MFEDRFLGCGVCVVEPAKDRSRDDVVRVRGAPTLGNRSVAVIRPRARICVSVSLLAFSLLPSSADGDESFFTARGDLPGGSFTSQARATSANGAVVVGRGNCASYHGSQLIWETRVESPQDNVRRSAGPMAHKLVRHGPLFLLTSSADRSC